MKSSKEQAKPHKVAISWDEWHYGNQNAAPISPEASCVGQSTASKPSDPKKAAKPKATRSNRRPLVSWNAWHDAEENLSNQLEAATLGKRTKGSPPFANQNNASTGSRHDSNPSGETKARPLSAPGMSSRRYRDLDNIGPSNCFDSNICDYTDIHLTDEDDMSQ